MALKWACNSFIIDFKMAEEEKEERLVVQEH
jgi:hypothetical protein